MMQVLTLRSPKSEIDREFRRAAEATASSVRAFAHQHGLSVEEERDAQAMALARLERWLAQQYQAAGVKT